MTNTFVFFSGICCGAPTFGCHVRSHLGVVRRSRKALQAYNNIVAMAKKEQR